MQRLTPSLLPLVTVLLFGPALAGMAAPEITEALVQARFEKGQTLANDGFAAPALKEFLWCYDEGMVAVPSFKGMRTTAVIPAIKRLANDYGPAEEAMNKHCTDAETRLLAGDAAAAGEFTAWCAALNDERRVLKTFDKLPAGDPRRRGFGMAAFTPLVAKKRYADALSAMPYETMTKMIDAQFSRLANSPRASDEAREGAINLALDCVEVLAGAKDAAHANEIVAKLKAFDSANTTKRGIEKRLKRAG